jgi:hypothetical protein
LQFSRAFYIKNSPRSTHDSRPRSLPPEAWLPPLHPWPAPAGATTVLLKALLAQPTGRLDSGVVGRWRQLVAEDALGAGGTRGWIGVDASTLFEALLAGL